ncbi:MAG TPA: hypothetical protein VKZ96_01255 [Thermomicrobiales bacterium]|nr:hypothetical protein [Thermomicrobiales bacterium]
MPDSDGKYTKVEREILEILDELEDRGERRRPSNVIEFRRPQRKRPRIQMPDLSELRYALTPAKLMLIMFASILGAVFLQSVPFVSPILIIVAIAAFAGIFFAKSRPSPGSIGTRSTTKRWRGRDIDLTRRR